MSMLDKKVGPFSMFQFIGIVGAVLVVISFFLAWATGTIGSVTEQMTGMDFFDEGVGDDWQNMIPVITLVLAIIALVISIVPGEYLGGAKTEKLLGILSIVVAVVMLVLVVLFMVWFSDYLVSEPYFTISYGIGTYLSLIGSILVFIVGVLPLVKDFVS